MKFNYIKIIVLRVIFLVFISDLYAQSPLDIIRASSLYSKALSEYEAGDYSSAYDFLLDSKKSLKGKTNKDLEFLLILTLDKSGNYSSAYKNLQLYFDNPPWKDNEAKFKNVALYKDPDGKSYEELLTEKIVEIETNYQNEKAGLAPISSPVQMQPSSKSEDNTMAVPENEAADLLKETPMDTLAPPVAAPVSTEALPATTMATPSDTVAKAVEETLPIENTVDTEKVYLIADKSPELIGGIMSLYEKIKYPKIAASGRVEGRVFLEFIVDQQGNVVNPTVIKGIGSGCDEEALRVIKEAKFNPALIKNIPVKFQTSLPIIFRLE